MLILNNFVCRYIFCNCQSKLSFWSRTVFLIFLDKTRAKKKSSYNYCLFFYCVLKSSFCYENRYFSVKMDRKIKLLQLPLSIRILYFCIRINTPNKNCFLYSNSRMFFLHNYCSHLICLRFVYTEYFAQDWWSPYIIMCTAYTA